MAGHDFSAISQEIDTSRLKACIVSSTVRLDEMQQAQLRQFCPQKTLFLNATTPIPLRNLYLSPDTLGPDRLAAAIGAYDESYYRRGRHTPVLIIDAGTAITFDFVSEEGDYLGGNISPGTDMRLKALHEFTSQLPAVYTQPNIDVSRFHNPLQAEAAAQLALGTDTRTAIWQGVHNGVKKEIEGYIQQWTVKFPYLSVFLTGGDEFDFDETVKKRIFADKFLVAKGLNHILKGIYNEETA